MAIGVNVVGLRRAGKSPEVRQEIQEAFQTLYRSGQIQRQTIEALRTRGTPEVRALAEFVDGSKRGIINGSEAAERRSTMEE